MAFKFKDLVNKICLFTTSVLLSSSFSVFSPVIAATDDAPKNTDEGLQLATVTMYKGELKVPENVTGLGYDNLFGKLPTPLIFSNAAQDPFNEDNDKGLRGIKVVFNNQTLYSFDGSNNKVDLYIRKVKSTSSTSGEEDPDVSWTLLNSENYDSFKVTNPGIYDYYFYVDGKGLYTDIRDTNAVDVGYLLDKVG